MADSDKGKLGLPALTALVVGGIIGSGIFSLPQNMAEGAGAGAILIAWAITFVGMLTLTRIFQWLSTTRPELDDGVYGYAREGFGEYLGFNAAWGYWISAWVGNAGYLVVLFSALGSFGALAFFGDGTTWPALLGELTVLWLMHAFVLHGVHNAAITNAIVTLAKVVPIALFILCVALAFRIETFHLDFWGSPALGSVTPRWKPPCSTPSGYSSASRAPRSMPATRGTRPMSAAQPCSASWSPCCCWSASRCCRWAWCRSTNWRR